MTEIKRVYVIAKNYPHFRTWCRENDVNPNSPYVRFVSTPDVLWGVTATDSEFAFYETWMEHPQAHEIYQQVQIARVKATATPLLVGRQKIMDPNNSLWYRLTKLEPAVYRGLIVAVVAILATVGVSIAPGLPDQIIALIWAVSAIVQALWTRQSVTANAKVAVSVPDPVNAPQVVEAGEAMTTAPDKQILEAAKA